MRTLVFEPSSKRFELAYQSLLFSPLPVQGNERKVHGELLNKLEAIAQLKQPLDANGNKRDYASDEIRLYVSVGGGEVKVSDAEFDLLKRHTNSMADAPNFTKAMSREMDALLEYLAALKLDEPATAKA